MGNDGFTFESNSEIDTRRLGAALAETLPTGANVALIGTLGAGKTRLVQAVATALGVLADDVTSPTFVLVNQYFGRQPIVHIDAYRLRDEDEFQELGPEEFFESDAIVFVEWADRIAESMPTDQLEIRIESVGEEARTFSFSSRSELLCSAISRLRRLLIAD